VQASPTQIESQVDVQQDESCAQTVAAHASQLESSAAPAVHTS